MKGRAPHHENIVIMGERIGYSWGGYRNWSLQYCRKEPCLRKYKAFYVQNDMSVMNTFKTIGRTTNEGGAGGMEMSEDMRRN